MDPIAKALKQALAKAPASQRELCRAAGINNAFLWRILRGERRASPALCLKLAKVLERWGSDCTAGAETIRQAVAQHHALTKEEE